jgi:two-component system OmpR family sensor kinase
LPLAVRLVLIYALVVGAALLVVAALAVQLTRSQLHRQVEARMVAVADSFASGPAGTVASADELPDAAREWLRTQPAPADQAVLVRTSSGEVLTARSGLALGDIEGSSDLLASSDAGWSTLEDPDEPVLALTVPLTLGDSEVGTLVVASSTRRVDEGVGDLLRQVMWACAAGFVLAVVLGLLAVRRTLRPLEQMASDIDRLQASGDVSDRVRVSGPADEVGRLGLAFNRTLGRLQQVVDSQRQFVADASHELRTPLTVARGQLELLAEDGAGDDPDAARSIGIAVGELDRMARMVRDLLLLARLDEGLDLQRERVDVELLVEDAVLRATPPAPSAAGTRTVIDVDVAAGTAVTADAESLLQVVSNLLVNAVHHGGGPVAVAARAHGDTVVIAVSDDGPGIADDDLPHVFERFYRGGQTGRAVIGGQDGEGGTGLGLAIAKGLVERMGGRIDVRSVPGEGTTFTIGLPAAEAGVGTESASGMADAAPDTAPADPAGAPAAPRQG